ncbi:uncharacterized protein [Oscarella lobularis]|uniref:uncharacterized protein n=1 Tax=Oscarella lobularis TaxID=121494 RepID=UPI0033137907
MAAEYDDEKSGSGWGPGGGRPYVGLFALILFVGAVVVAAVAVGIPKWAAQETNLYNEKRIGVFQQCTEQKNGKTTCESISGIQCSSTTCDTMKTRLTAIGALMIVGTILSLVSAVLCCPGIQMHRISCIVGIVAGVLYVIAVVLFATIDRNFNNFFFNNGCFSTSFGCAIAALFLVWCASVVAGIASREPEEEEEEE